MRKILKVIAALILSAGVFIPAGNLGAQGVTAEQYYAAGNQMMAAKSFDKALQYYQAALQLKPDHVPSLVGVGNSQYSLGRKQEALAAYEKALELDPKNTQVEQFVKSLKAQPASAAPAAPAAAGTDSLKQGTDLFAQKKYVEAIPFLEEAARQNPANGTIDYYLGYAHAVNKDSRNAALSFYRSDRKSPNTSVKAYADRVKATLTLADQQWVDAQLAGGPSAGKAKTAVTGKKKKISLRLMPAIALANLKDFKSDAEARQATIRAIQTSSDPAIADPSASFEGKVPTGFLQYGAELGLAMSPKLGLGFSFGMVPAGKYTFASAGALPSAWTDSGEVKISGMNLGVGFRYKFGQGKLKPFLGLGAAYVPVKLTWAETLTQTSATVNLTGDFKATAIGMQAQLGADFSMGESFALTPFVGYRMAKAKTFKGTGGVSSGALSASAAGKLVVYTDTNGTPIAFLADDPAVATQIAAIMDWPDPLTGARDLEVDLGGIQGGLMLSFFF
jgi:tetratricopeptide (TPR) repeat protein